MSRKGVTPQYPVGNKRGWFNESRAKSAALVVVAAVAPHPQPHSYKMDWGCWWGPLTPTSLLQSPSSKRHIIFFVGSPLYSLGLVENMRWNFFLQRFFGCGGTSELVRCTYLPRCPSYSLQKYFVSGSINCPFPTKSLSLSLSLPAFHSSLFLFSCFWNIKNIFSRKKLFYKLWCFDFYFHIG